MSFTHYIDGVAVNEPGGWDDFEQEISRDFDTRTISTSFPSEATFTGEGYKRLRALFVADDCGIVSYEAYDECDGLRILIVRADIILADCEWNLNRCEVNCSLVDDGIGSRISNNKGIEIFPTATETKNADALSAVPVIPLEVFNPVNGLYYAPVRRAFDWMEAIQHAVRYITDSNVTVVSQWYNSLPDDERIAVLSGYQLRTADASPNGEWVSYSFEDLFMEVAKKYNLWMAVQRDLSGNPFIVIEQEPALFSNAVAASFPWQDNLIQSIDRDQLWATVRVGSEDGLPNQGAVQALPFLILQGFSNEKFHFEGVCNTQAELDLLSEWGIDTNVIERLVLNNDDGYDKTTFLVQYNRTTNEAVQSDWLNPGGLPALYNEQLMNVNVLNRYSLPSNVGQFVGDQDESFEAVRSTLGTDFADTSAGTTVGSFVAAPFQIPISDPGGNYTASFYTAPTQGYYVFQVRRLWDVTANSFPVTGFNIQKRIVSRIRFERRDAANVLLGFWEFEDSVPIAQAGVFTPVGPYTHAVDQGIVLNATDTVRVLFAYTGATAGDPLATGTITARDRTGSAFLTTFVASGGGILTNINPANARILTYSFDRLTTARQWTTLIGDPSQAIQVSTDDNLKTGHIMSATRNILKGTTSYEIICKRDQK
jgi:hypothetical protein